MTLIDRQLRHQPESFIQIPSASGIERRVAMTEAEYYQLPDARVEFVDGEAVFMSPVSLFHADLLGFVYRYTQMLAERSNAGRVFLDSVTVRLSPRVSRVPDLSFIAATNTRAQLKENHIDGPPDLVIEIVSPESRLRDYRYKFNDYQAAGIPEYWIIDPTFQSIDLSRLDDTGHYVEVPEVNGALTSNILPGLVLRAEWLKQPTLPKLSELL